ncbi:MAG: family 43 glycosylhydrolase, partial [Halanaerobiales bacterium]
PAEWMALDGTLFVDDKGDPWMVFCHEWVQIYDGTICAVKLTKDLKERAGEVVTLFAASEAPWTRSIRVVHGRDCYVTDGPFFYRTKNNKLLLLWSSFVEDNTYAIGFSHSESGAITGPWIHEEKPLYDQDAGHGMLFRNFDGRLMLTIHTPNKIGAERPIFIELIEENDSLYLKE